MKKIVLTGGGTGGHVTPNIALLDRLKENDYEIVYIGRKEKDKEIIEKKLIESENIKYYGIDSGKLRRYISFDNMKDAFYIIKGISDAKKLLKKIKPDVIFSKGGFVTVPVILSAKMCKIPVVIHESDYTPGLANKISIPIAKKVCVSFEETLKYLPEEKGIVTGPPIRKELFKGDAQKGKRFCQFKEDKPVILVIGGSSGAKAVNEIIWDSIDNLIKNYNVVHICGKDNRKNINVNGYVQFEYIDIEMKDLFAYSDMVISRAGSNSIFEILALKKPNILIPLSKKASRGDQILNAQDFENKNYSIVIEEENLTEKSLLKAIEKLEYDKDSYIKYMEKSNFKNGIDKIINEIIKYTK